MALRVVMTGGAFTSNINPKHIIIMEQNNETKSFMEVMGLQDFKSIVNILTFGAMMTLPLLAACAFAEWLNNLY